MTLRTKRVYLGTAVTPLPSRLPWELAREVITLDHLSSSPAVGRRAVIRLIGGEVWDRSMRSTVS